MPLVEAMGIVASDIARQLDSVAPEIFRPTHRLVEQVSTDTHASNVVRYVHRFDLGAPPAAVLEVPERDELEHADHGATELGDHQVRTIGLVDFVQGVGIVIEVQIVVDTDIDLAAQDQSDELLDVIVEGVAEIQLHGLR